MQMGKLYIILMGDVSQKARHYNGTLDVKTKADGTDRTGWDGPDWTDGTDGRPASLDIIPTLDVIPTVDANQKVRHTSDR